MILNPYYRPFYYNSYNKKFKNIDEIILSIEKIILTYN